MQYLKVALPLAALASGALAAPWDGDACLAAVTGKAALGDAKLRSAHCASYLHTTVTPPAITVTETITGDGKDSHWKRASVTVCPNEVPNYASACDDAGYSSACSKFGFTEVFTTTIAPTTTTKTVYVRPTGACDTVTKTVTTILASGSTCPAAETETDTVTKTVGGHGSTKTITETDTTTKTVGGSGVYTSTVTKTVGHPSASGIITITKTVSGSGSVSTLTKTVGGSASVITVTKTVSGSPSSSSSAAPSKCIVDDAKATELVSNFASLLEFTNYAGNATLHIPPGRGYKQDVSDATLTTDFVDISDSINFMAGFPLGSITFPNKAYFDYGQGVLQPEVSVTTLNIFHDCNSVTWRWKILSNPQALPVTGINYMMVNEDGKIFKNYAEFDSGAWLQSFGQTCATNPVSVQPGQPALRRSL